MRRSVMFLLLFVMLTVSAFASTPTIEVSTNFVSKLNNTNGQSFGTFVVSKGQYISTITDVATVSGLSIQNYDMIRWQGTGSILVKSPSDEVVAILEIGQSYLFTTAGVYTYHVNGNSASNATIVVSSESIPTVSLSMNGTPIQYSLSTTSFVLDTSKVVNVTADVSVDVSANNYSYVLTASTSNQTKIINSTVLVPVQQTWEVVNFSFPQIIEVKAGDITSVGQITLTSTGNDNVNIASSVVGNGSFMLITQQSQTLFRKSNTAFGITIQVPLAQADGLYNATVVLSGGGYTKEIAFTISVKDTTAPILSLPTFNDSTIYHQTLIKSIVTDNIKVQNVTIQYFHGLTTTYNAPQFMISDQQSYSFVFMPDSLEEYSFQICAYDGSSNSYCNSTKHNFTMLDIIRGDSVVEVPAKKFGNIATKTLFNLTEPPQGILTVTLVSLTSNLVPLNETDNTTTENSYKVNIIDGDGSILAIAAVGQSVVISHTGEVKIQVQATALSQYQGVVKVSVPPHVKPVQDISFSGRFLNYDVPQPFVIPWLGKELSCGVVDTGDLTTSYYNCIVQLPISSDPQNLAIPVTPEQLSLQNETTTAAFESYESSISFRTKLISVLLMLVIISICLIIFVTKMYPYLRINFSMD